MKLTSLFFFFANIIVLNVKGWVNPRDNGQPRKWEIWGMKGNYRQLKSPFSFFFH